jgi:hypothetical protein
VRDLIRQKIVDALVEPIPDFTRRDVHIPAIANKAIAVVGVRAKPRFCGRSSKTGLRAVLKGMGCSISVSRMNAWPA